MTTKRDEMRAKLVELALTEHNVTMVDPNNMTLTLVVPRTKLDLLRNPHHTRYEDVMSVLIELVLALVELECAEEEAA